jgi:hypothetical protein
MAPFRPRLTLRRICGALVALTFVGSCLGVAADAVASRTATVAGNDFSWPQCAKGVGNGQGQPLPSGHRQFMIVGLTNGTGLHENPCLAEQWAFARAHADRVTGYTVPTYPTRAQRVAARAGHYGRCHRLPCQLRNSGWAQGEFAATGLRRIGAHPPMVWVDVETRHQQPWSRYSGWNRLVIKSEVASLQHAGYRVGLYSTSYMWRRIAGYASTFPEWVPADSTTRGCSRPFSRGPVWLSQFSHYYRRLHTAYDENGLCRRAPAMRRMFERAP